MIWWLRLLVAIPIAHWIWHDRGVLSIVDVDSLIRSSVYRMIAITRSRILILHICLPPIWYILLVDWGFFYVCLSLAFCLFMMWFPFIRVILPFLGFFPLIPNNKGHFFCDNFCILSPFYLIQLAVDSEWKDICHAAISRNFLEL